MSQNCTDTMHDDALPQRPLTEGLWSLCRAWAGFLVGRVLTWHERARQRRQLLMLDDRMLKDIGLTRADVDEEIRKPFWLP